MALPTAALIIGGIGAGVSAIGALGSASATASAANYQAQVAQNNATIAAQNAETATQAGQAQATAQSLQGRAALGAITSGEAANGLDINSGSALDTRATQREFNELNTETTAANAALQAYGYRTQSTNFQAEAGLQQMTASSALEAGGIGAAGSLLGGASSLGLKWSILQNAGALGGGTGAGVAAQVT